MDCSAETWSTGYGLSYLPTLETSSTGVFFSWLMGDGLVFGLDITRVWDFVFFYFCVSLRMCVSCVCDAEAGSLRSRKLYFLDVIFLNINKAFPYRKKLGYKLSEAKKIVLRV
jgi:hypothetical protein